MVSAAKIFTAIFRRLDRLSDEAKIMFRPTMSVEGGGVYSERKELLLVE